MDTCNQDQLVQQYYLILAQILRLNFAFEQVQAQIVRCQFLR
ncbi:MAG: hypothetical protein N2376_08345 [Clostridia bacterium]|nr:hypothetical protein [Clostridia bacterium]